jgi:ribosome assembly protein YihI (activator of Der GTPase)
MTTPDQLARLRDALAFHQRACIEFSSVRTEDLAVLLARLDADRALFVELLEWADANSDSSAALWRRVTEEAKR